MNLTEINNNMLRVIDNADSQGDFLQDFLGLPAKDVTFKNITASGDTITRTVPNVAKFTDSVRNAVTGEMKKTYFLDQNADDGGDGSEFAPFNSLEALVAGRPFGSLINIYIVGEYITNTSQVASMPRVNLAFHQKDDSSKLTIRIDSENRFAISSADSSIEIRVNMKIENAFDDTLRNAFFVYRSCFLFFGLKKDLTPPNVEVGENCSIAFLRDLGGLSIIAMNFIDNNSGSSRIANIRHGNLYVSGELNDVMFNSEESDSWSDLQEEVANRISGAIKTNDVPININTNVLL